MNDANAPAEIQSDIADKVTEPNLPPLATGQPSSASPDFPRLETDAGAAALPAFPVIGREPAPTPTPLAPAPAPEFDPVFDIATIEVEHARWLTSDGKEGKRANFRGLDLSGVDLSGRHLAEASLRGTILQNANLSGTDLRAADLSEAILDHANLDGTLLYGAALTRAQLHQVHAIGADMTTANFTGAIAEGINLNGARMNGAILRDANFRHADFTHAVLRDANLRSATLVEANLSTADLSAADCRDVNFDRANFAGAVLEKTNFRGAKLEGIDFRSADFSTALDVSSEFKAQSLQSEREKLLEDQASLTLREGTFAKENERIKTQSAWLADMQAKQAELAPKLTKLSRGFTIRFFLWLLVAALVGAFTLVRASEMSVTGMVGVMAVVGAVLLLALFSMFRSIQIARLLSKVTAERPRDTGAEKTEPSSADAVPVFPEPSQKIMTKSKATGFGKK